MSALIRGAIDNGSRLKPPNFLTALASEDAELDVHLDVMTGNQLVIVLGVDITHSRSARPTPSRLRMCVSHAYEIHNAVIARQVPNDPDRPEVVFAAQI